MAIAAHAKGSRVPKSVVHGESGVNATGMATDIEFSSAALSAAARRHIRLFQIHQFLDRFAMGLTVAVVALALTDRGMDLFQISLLFGIYALTTLAMELPFGGLADSIGRKPVFQAAVTASLLALALFMSTSNFYVLALSFAFIGFGRALRSGTLDAWFVETFKTAAPNVDVQPALAKAQWANAMGLALGAVLGGLLPDLFGGVAKRFGSSIYDVSYAASFAVMTGVFVFTMRAIVESPRPRNAAALMRGFANVPMVIKASGGLALRHPTLSVLLTSLAFFLMATNPVEVLWPVHAKPMLEEGRANTLIGTMIGMVTASYFFAIAFGAFLSSRVSRIFKRRHAMTLAACFAGLAVVQIALALQGGFIGFVAVFILFAVILGICETPASSILHRCVEDHQRSTMLSLRSLIQQLGAALGLVLAGAIAEVYSTPIAWMVGAVFLGLAALLILVLVKRLAEGAGEL
jgi:DHA1 family quinolone resistance protein-like MFS transporter